MPAVEIQTISKRFKSLFTRKMVDALVNVSFTVEEGEIFGLLGPNGAGKTTLVKILLGITFPTSGTASIFGENICHYQIREKVGYLPENHRYPSFLTGEQVLDYFGKLSGIESGSRKKKIDELLDLVKMTRWRKMKIKKYSKGMMQRLGMAQALINEPDIIFLDEPTDGIDPIGRKEIRDILLALKNEGKTIFLNSHLLLEVELISDRIGILDNGLLVKEGKISDLTNLGQEYQIVTEQLEESEKEIFIKNYSDIEIQNGTINLTIKDLKELNDFIDLLRQKNIVIKSVFPKKSSLEDIFIDTIKMNKDENISTH